MSAFFIVTVNVKDGEKFQEYAGKASATFQPYGAELLVKGQREGEFAGSFGEHKAVAVMKFPSLEKMEAWYSSPEYQELIPLRDEGAEVKIIKYVMPDA